MRALWALALLGACSAPFEGEKLGSFGEVYRDLNVTIASKAVFDPAQYLGTWYEVARYPVFFERGCVGVTATYGLRADGAISVLNICRNPDGSIKSRIEGKAVIAGPGRLKVSFPLVPFGASDYWVLWVDEGYRTAVVGAPNGKSGWILNRDPQIPTDRLNTAREILDFNGYDLDRLMEVPQ